MHAIPVGDSLNSITEKVTEKSAKSNVLESKGEWDKRNQDQRMFQKLFRKIPTYSALTGETPFSCAEWSKIFTFLGILRQHLRSMLVRNYSKTSAAVKASDGNSIWEERTWKWLRMWLSPSRTNSKAVLLAICEVKPPTSATCDRKGWIGKTVPQNPIQWKKVHKGREIKIESTENLSQLKALFNPLRASALQIKML